MHIYLSVFFRTEMDIGISLYGINVSDAPNVLFYFIDILIDHIFNFFSHH